MHSYIICNKNKSDETFKSVSLSFSVYHLFTVLAFLAVYFGILLFPIKDEARFRNGFLG